MAESQGATETAASPAQDHAPIRHLYLIDGSGYIFRAYHKLPPTMTRPDGTPTHAVYGFTTMLMKLLRELETSGQDSRDAVAVIFDAGEDTFRKDIYPQYKANRPELPEDLAPQFPLVRDASRAFNLPTIEERGFEADDLIASYVKAAREAGIEVVIVSSDKDLMQLIQPGVTMMDPMDGRMLGVEEVEKKFGVAPEKVVDVQALWGDSVDNVPGVPGIGQKIAAELIGTYGSLEALLERAGEIKQPKRRQNLIDFAEQARISKQLVTLKDDVPLALPLDALRAKKPDPEVLRGFLEENAFTSIIARLGLEAGGNGSGGAAAEEAPLSAEDDYSLVQDLATLEAWIAEARAEGLVAVDTETTSLDAMSAELVGISLAIRPGKACYIPLGHKAPGAAPEGGLDFDGGGGAAPEQIPMEAALAALKPLLSDPGVLKVGQHIKYDSVVLGRYGVALGPIDDTMLLSYVLGAGLHNHGMDELADRHLGRRTIKYAEVAGTGKAQVTFDRVPLDKALAYAAEDADVTLRLHTLLKPRLLKERLVTVYETLERPLSPVLAEMESLGVKVDRDILRRLSNDFAERLEALEGEIYELAGKRFTIGSPKQLGEILFEEMGLSSQRKGKSGAYSTDAEVLQGLANQGHALPAKVLDWRQLAKLKSTYTDALQQQIDPRTGRVHTSYMQAVASTGRLSSTNPNLQNIPIRSEEGRKIRQAFVAEQGYRLLSVDYSQIELRLAAHIADEPALKQAFAEGQDIHAATASQVFGVPIEGMDPMVRRSAKAINFGIIYGISPFGLAQNLGIEQAKARAYIEAYFERYPAIKAYMDSAKATAREKGYVTTLFGRRIHTPEIKDKNFSRRAFSERAAINAPIQGTAADIIKRAMVRVPPALARAGLGARMLLQVHDELLFEVPDGEMEATIIAVRETMEAAAAPAVTLSVPLVADAGQGHSWAEAH